SDSYLFHDQLADENTPFYISDFIARAARAGLQYAGDGLGVGVALDPGAEEFLAAAQTREEREQYYDFLTNRRFRLAILTPAGHDRTASLPVDTHKAHFTESKTVSARPAAYPYARQQVMARQD